MPERIIGTIIKAALESDKVCDAVCDVVVKNGDEFIKALSLAAAALCTMSIIKKGMELFCEDRDKERSHEDKDKERSHELSKAELEIRKAEIEAGSKATISEA